MASQETIDTHDGGEEVCHICGLKTEYSPVHGMRYCGNCGRCAFKDIVFGIEIFHKWGKVTVRDYIDSEVPGSTFRYRETLFVWNYFEELSIESGMVG